MNSWLCYSYHRPAKYYSFAVGPMILEEVLSSHGSQKILMVDSLIKTFPVCHLWPIKASVSAYLIDGAVLQSEILNFSQHLSLYTYNRTQ